MQQTQKAMGHKGQLVMDYAQVSTGSYVAPLDVVKRFAPPLKIIGLMSICSKALATARELFTGDSRSIGLLNIL